MNGYFCSVLSFLLSDECVKCVCQRVRCWMEIAVLTSLSAPARMLGADTLLLPPYHRTATHGGTRACAHAHAHTHARPHTHTHTHTHSTQTHTHTHAYAHTHTRTHTHTPHTHTHTPHTHTHTTHITKQCIQIWLAAVSVHIELNWTYLNF